MSISYENTAMKNLSLPTQQLLKTVRKTFRSRSAAFTTTCQWQARQTRFPEYKTRHIPKDIPAPAPAATEPSSSRRTYAVWAIAGLFVAIGVSKQLDNKREKKIFDPPRFTPFEIIKREEASPTSIILTLRPRNLPSSKDAEASDPYKEEREKGTWSVEFKQPELQIARRYTPLPPTAETAKTDLRFLVRKEHKGEMSGYLHTLVVGAEIGLRGPHREYELPENVSRVAFLAAGTGIAPALQVAHTFLERKSEQKPKIHIVWANRRREDCEGGFGPGKKPLSTKKSKIVQELDGFQKRYPGQILVDYLVDEEGTLLNQKMISQTVAPDASSSSGTSQLILISGPEGFVNYVAGPKVWENGKEGQGSLGGLLSQMKLKGWIVWKL